MSLLFIIIEQNLMLDQGIVYFWVIGKEQKVIFYMIFTLTPLLYLGMLSFRNFIFSSLKPTTISLKLMFLQYSLTTPITLPTTLTLPPNPTLVTNSYTSSNPNNTTSFSPSYVPHPLIFKQFIRQTRRYPYLTNCHCNFLDNAPPLIYSSKNKFPYFLYTLSFPMTISILLIHFFV